MLPETHIFSVLIVTRNRHELDSFPYHKQSCAKRLVNHPVQSLQVEFREIYSSE